MAAGMLGVPPRGIRALAGRGLINSKQVVLGRRLVSRADFERLARESVVSAGALAGDQEERPGALHRAGPLGLASDRMRRS